MIREESMLIDGVWRGSENGSVVEIENPATRQIVASVPRATDRDLSDALEGAQRSQESWANLGAWSRSEILRQTALLIRERHENIATLLTEEQGKPIAQARAEVLTAAEQFDWYADEARRIYGRIVDATSPSLRIQVRREPIGPVAAFTPWNFPVMLAARKLAPALAAGCPVILKPAEEAPSACLAMVRALHDAGAPAGTVAAVTGDPAHISKALLASPIIRKLSLTGSVRVGQHLMRLAAENLTAVSLELGGHGPVIVCDDVDVDLVAAMCVAAKYRNAGQVCISPTRFLVDRSVIERFEAAFVRATQELTLGDGMSDSVDVGPLCSAHRHDDFAALVDDAVSRGAGVATGARSRRNEMGGYYYEPTVLRDIPSDARILHDEPFGPVALMIGFDSLEHAVALANSTRYGLAGYLFTNDVSRAQLLSERVKVGMLGINTFAISTAVAPFSGVGMSGIGAENGTEGIDMYLHPKTVVTGIVDPL